VDLTKDEVLLDLGHRQAASCLLIDAASALAFAPELTPGRDGRARWACRPDAVY
jgi:hypothetical protein